MNNPQSRTPEGSSQRQPSDTESVPSQSQNANLSDDKLPKKKTATKDQPSETQDNGSEKRNLKPINASKGQSIQKPRKPYTITKSREVWTKDEHARFLSALQIYDRDWKKIEVYIGTKTVLQIRSHAQKHFGKVTKYKTGEYIPPPRPKKRAALPYPRSCPATPTKASAGTPGTSRDEDLDISEERTEECTLKRDATIGSGIQNDCSGLLKPETTTPEKEGICHNRKVSTEAQNHERISAVRGMGKPQSSNSPLRKASEKVNFRDLSDKKTLQAVKKGVTKNYYRSGLKFRSSEQTEAYSEALNRRLERNGRHDKSVSEDRSSCGKRASMSSIEGAPSPKRQTLRGLPASSMSRVSVGIDEARDGNDDADLGLGVESNSLLVLSDCVDMMSRKDRKDSDTVQTRWKSTSPHTSTTKVARARSTSVVSSGDEIEGEDCLNTSEVNVSPQVKAKAVIHSTQNGQNGSPVVMENQQGGHTIEDRRTGSPLAEVEDGNNEDRSGDPQRSSVGSGSASDDPIAGLTCSDRPSISDNGLGSSCEGSGSGGSLNSSPPGEGEEDPKSSNEGSGDDIVRQGVSSRGSSPADPNSSVSREVSPTSNCIVGETGGRPDINAQGLEQNEQKEMVEKMSNLVSSRNSSQATAMGGNDISHQKSLQNVRNVPISKTIAHLINDLEELECPSNFKLSQQTRHDESSMKTGYRQSVQYECGRTPRGDERVSKNDGVSKRWQPSKKEEAINR